MTQQSVELDPSEWQQVLGILAMAPWRDANPLLMKIGEQLRLKQNAAAGRSGDGISRELPRGLDIQE